MKIAFVYDAAYPWNVGGIEAIEDAEARELAKSNDVHFFSLKWPGMKPLFRRNNITYHAFHDETIDKFYRHGRRSVREALVFSVGLTRLFKYRFDFVVANQFPMLHIWVLRLYCKLTGCKLIMDVSEVWDKEYWTRYIGEIPGSIANAYASRVLGWADAYTVYSEEMKKKLAANGIDEKKISVFAPVIEHIPKSSMPNKPQKRIVFFGRLIKEKRLDKWLNVIKKVKGEVPEVKALIRGEGPDRSRIQRMIKRLGLSSSVKLMGFTEQKSDMYRELESASLLLQMSEREGLSIIVLESIALGTPVVLPSYSPVPSDVQRMCTVVSEKDVVAKVVEILKSRKKSTYIRNRQMLASYSVSNINEFYSKLFAKLKRK